MISLKPTSNVHRLTLSGLVITLYIVIMLLTQSFAFMQYQIRIATALYALGAMFPFLVLPLGLANLLSNVLMGGLGLLDALGGFAAGVLTTAACCLIGKRGWHWTLVSLPVIFIPGLLVPIWLSYLLQLPYHVLASNLLIGQIVPGIVGALLVRTLKKFQ